VPDAHATTDADAHSDDADGGMHHLSDQVAAALIRMGVAPTLVVAPRGVMPAEPGGDASSGREALISWVAKQRTATEFTWSPSVAKSGSESDEGGNREEGGDDGEEDDAETVVRKLLAVGRLPTKEQREAATEARMARTEEEDQARSDALEQF